MALSLKNKLFAGFGLVIGISMITGGVIIHEARIIEERSTFVLEESVPTMLNVSTLRGSIHNALSMHRGYMILGLEELGGERLKAWDSINGAMDELKVISSDWPADQVELVSELDDVLVQFRTAQDEIAAVSHTPEDRPADELFFHHALPKSEQVVKALEHILDLEHDEETTPERKVLVEHVAAAEAHLLKASSAVSAFLVTGLEEDEEYVNKCVNLCSESVERLKTDIDLFTPEQKKSFDDYLTYRGEFLDLATESIAIRKSDNWCVSQNICLNTVTPLAGKADQIAHEIVEKQAKSQMAAGANAREQLAHAVAALPVIVVIASIVSVLFGGVIAWFLARNIGLIIREVASRAHAIASRDLTIEPLEVKTKDDLGKLSMSVNEMLHSLREILTDVNDSSNAVAQMSDQIMNSSTEVASGMEMQMVEIQQISAAATQMAASVGEVAGSSRNASETATESAETAREGGNVVSEVVMRMDEIRNSVEASAESVSELGHQSEQIGEIISVINDIADQTNLLALNAAIEAARAGEHGRGFAVVADEVRKLAERTQVATEEVSTTISTIQVETKAAVDRMNAGTEVVAQGVELTQNAGKSLNEIVSGAGMVTSQVQSIAAAAEEQAAASEEISRGITEISNVVRNSKASTDESTAMANELASRAQGLKEIVGKFSI